MRTHRRRPHRTPMTLDEAHRIVGNAQDGLIDVRDPEVAHVVAQANRILVRARTWGTPSDASNRRWRMISVVASIVFIAMWVTGLFAPLFKLS